MAQRRGLCALPVAMMPRTELPTSDSCPKLEPGDENWPFPDYSWNIEGNFGEIASQVMKHNLSQKSGHTYYTAMY